MNHSGKLPTLDANKALDELARRHLLDFTKRLWHKFHATEFHINYYNVLDAFCKGYIKKLIVTIPPQHGKSQGSSKYAPAFMLGLNPDLNIALMSYSTAFARKFNRHLQRVIDTDEYKAIFPKTLISSETRDNSYQRNADLFEVINYNGSFKGIGREGALTGNPVDVMIFDDLYKGDTEGNSPIVRDNVIEMYKAVAETRLHNNSQEMCVFTRWHEEDLIGWFEKNYNVITLTSLSQIFEIEDWTNTWVKINYEAIKESEKTELDSREIGEPLYPERHSLKRLESKRKNDPLLFNCMYQGDPQPKEGLLYSAFKTYSAMPQTKKKANYTDTADEGDDFLCSICYEVGLDNYIYVTDIIYTQESMEITERTVSLMIQQNGTKDPRIESNNGGRGFARAIQAKLPNTSVRWFYQAGNKESRILTNASQVNEKIFFPIGWDRRWASFANHIKTYKRLFKANKYDDAPDCLTGIIETEYSLIQYGKSSASNVPRPSSI